MRFLAPLILSIIAPVCVAQDLTTNLSDDTKDYSQISLENTRLVVNLASKHINYTPTRKHPKLNEDNLGLGLDIDTSEDTTFSIGLYRNSYDRSTIYVGGSWTPYMFFDDTLKAGVFGAVATGYSEVNHGKKFIPLAGIKLALQPQKSDFGLNFSFIVSDLHPFKTVLGLQVTYALEK